MHVLDRLWCSFVLAPLIIFTSDPELMRVKSHKTELVRIKPTQIRPHFEVPEELVHYQATNKNNLKKEAHTSTIGPTVSFANGRMMKVITWLIFVLCSVSNIYAIVQLSQGQQ
jgi:Mn2+/Fe2+ NRAMP family transporter